MIMESPGLQQIVSDSQTDQDVVVVGTPIQISVSSSPVRRLELDESFADSNASSPDQGDPNVSLQAAMDPHGAVDYTPVKPDDEKYDSDEDPGTERTRYMQTTQKKDFLHGFIDRKDLGPPLQSFNIPEDLSVVSGATAYSRFTGVSMAVQVRRPIGGTTIVRLKDIKRRMGKKVELFSDASMLGFDRKLWEGKLFKKYPLDFSVGFKKNLGPWINTNYNKKGKSLSFVVKNKASPFQLNSLIGFIEGKAPPFHYLTIFRKGRVFEEVYNITGLQDFREYLRNELTSTPQIHIKITW